MTAGSTKDPRTLAEVSTDDLQARIKRLRERLDEVRAGTTTITEGQIREMIGRYQAELRRRGPDAAREDASDE